jgi:hypothetical protein
MMPDSNTGISCFSKWKREGLQRVRMREAARCLRLGAPTSPPQPGVVSRVLLILAGRRTTSPGGVARYVRRGLSTLSGHGRVA